MVSAPTTTTTTTTSRLLLLLAEVHSGQSFRHTQCLTPILAVHGVHGYSV
jgi:hypothetical protein